MTTTPQDWDQRCVAVIGAIEAHMGKVCMHMMLKAANQENFVNFLKNIREVANAQGVTSSSRTRVYVYLDNASIHRGDDVREYAAEHGIHLLYNVSYRPDLNGIEGFWNAMKRIYRR